MNDRLETIAEKSKEITNDIDTMNSIIINTFKTRTFDSIMDDIMMYKKDHYQEKEKESSLMEESNQDPTLPVLNENPIEHEEKENNNWTVVWKTSYAAPLLLVVAKLIGFL